jgi:Flp pilus assembly protein TadD
LTRDRHASAEIEVEAIMRRATHLCAVLAFCAFSASGCESTKEAAAKPPVDAAATASLDASPDAILNSDSDLATLSKTLPGTLDGEIRRAQLLRAKGDYDEAVKALAQLMLIAPDDPRVVGEYGKVLVQKGQSKEALAFLKRAIALQPHDWSVQSALGIAYDQLDDHTNARVAYDRALALKPDQGSVLNNYAVSRMLAGDYAGADRLLARAWKQDDGNQKIANNVAELARLKPPEVKTWQGLANSTGAAATPAPPTSPAGQPASLMPQPVLPAALQPARVAATVAKPAPVTKSNVVMQRVPADPLAGPTGTSRAAALKTPAPIVPLQATRVAQAGIVKAVMISRGSVVMERVPFDPLAGPVAGSHATVERKVAMTNKHPAAKHVAQKPLAPPPALRTASDGN